MVDIELDIFKSVIDRWQLIVDLMAEIVNVAAGLIVRFAPPYSEVIASSRTASNPFEIGHKVKLGMGYYIDEVFKTRKEVLITNAMKDSRWAKSPVVELGMTYYCGRPIFGPDGEIFGSICILDRKENPAVIANKKLLVRLQETIEYDLKLVADIHKQRLHTNGIREKHNHISSLAVQLSRARDYDRKHFAAGLHDDILQPLMFLRIKVNALLEKDKDTKRSIVYRQIQDVINELLKQTRLMTSKLDDPVLEELGLEAAAKQWLAEEVQKKHHLETIFKSNLSSGYLPGSNVKTFLFNSIKELTTNVIFHASAARIEVSMITDGDSVIVSIKDNGKGFSASDNNIVRNGRHGYGLLNIRLVLESIGGSLKINSVIGKGAEVVMTMPVNAKL